MIVPQDLLAGKKVLLGVTGSIAAYKSLELVRLLIKSGAEVKVVLSEAAQKFIAPLSFETLSRHEVLIPSTESWSSDHNHIGVVAWADLFVIAPCSANTINKLAQGIADNLLLQCALADPKPKIIAPSANTHMIHNPMTCDALQRLQAAGYHIVNTQTKELACQTTGDGAMADPQEIFWQTSQMLLNQPFWNDREAIVTGGGTIEKIDDVRYLSNFSSGKMASAIATALHLRGARVLLIATRHDSNLPMHVTVNKVQSSQEMQEGLHQSVENMTDTAQKTPYLFMAAAVSDYVPASPKTGKMKKTSLGETWQLDLQQNSDLLAGLNKNDIKTVAFKAEMDPEHAIDNARSLLSSKGADAVCLNVLKDSYDFGTDHHALTLITKEMTQTLPHSEKLTLALQMLDKAAKL